MEPTTKLFRYYWQSDGVTKSMLFFVYDGKIEPGAEGRAETPITPYYGLPLEDLEEAREADGWPHKGDSLKRVK